MIFVRFDPDLETMSRGLRSVISPEQNRAALYRLGAKMKKRLNRILEVANEGAPEASGDLVQSGKVTELEYGPRSVSGDVVYTAPYAIFVHEGRRPGKLPPEQPIIAWMGSRGIDDPDKSPEQVAFLIRRKIAREGIKPNKFLERAFLAERRGMIDELEQTYVEEAARSVIRVTTEAMLGRVISGK